MGRDKTTDVLSFPLVEVSEDGVGSQKYFSGQLLGDVLISLDQAKRQAKQQNLSLMKEVVFLTAHSLLHLMGHDHANPRQRRRMQAEESRIWQGLYRLRKCRLS